MLDAAEQTLLRGGLGFRGVLCFGPVRGPDSIGTVFVFGHFVWHIFTSPAGLSPALFPLYRGVLS